VKKRGLLGLLGLTVAALALAAAGCGGGGSESSGNTGSSVSGVTALPSSSCTGVVYEGDGDPDVLIASDLPMQGGDRAQTVQMTQAIEFVLQEANWKAGDKNVAYQVCDDSTAQAGKWDSGKCSQNGQAYAGDASMVGLVGTFNSGCAQIIIPILNQAPGGAMGMVSPANTLICLTQSSPACEKSEPDKYYPTGKRNYIRVVVHDAYQGAVQAQLMQDNGTQKLYILNDKESYGLGVATNVRNAAESVGIKVVGFDAWDPKQSNYEALFNKIKATGADAIFFGGLVTENGLQLMKDKVSVLGPNTGDVKLYAPDGWTPFEEVLKAGKSNVDGIYISVAGAAADKLTGAGKTFVDDFTKQENLSSAPEPYTAYAAQAAQVLLDAIANSDGSRQGVIDQLFMTNVTDGILGNFEINENGDPTSGPVTIYELVNGSFQGTKVITPEPTLVSAAGGT
jgi:branched-chain amino acid transport system substrate-binding protein